MTEQAQELIDNEEKEEEEVEEEEESPTSEELSEDVGLGDIEEMKFPEMKFGLNI